MKRTENGVCRWFYIVLIFFFSIEIIFSYCKIHVAQSFFFTQMFFSNATPPLLCTFLFKIGYSLYTMTVYWYKKKKEKTLLKKNIKLLERTNVHLMCIILIMTILLKSRIRVNMSLHVILVHDLTIFLRQPFWGELSVNSFWSTFRMEFYCDTYAVRNRAQYRSLTRPLRS